MHVYSHVVVTLFFGQYGRSIIQACPVMSWPQWKLWSPTRWGTRHGCSIPVTHPFCQPPEQNSGAMIRIPFVLNFMMNFKRSADWKLNSLSNSFKIENYMRYASRSWTRKYQVWGIRQLSNIHGCTSILISLLHWCLLCEHLFHMLPQMMKKWGWP